MKQFINSGNNLRFNVQWKLPEKIAQNLRGKKTQKNRKKCLNISQSWFIDQKGCLCTTRSNEVNKNGLKVVVIHKTIKIPYKKRKTKLK